MRRARSGRRQDGPHDGRVPRCCRGSAPPDACAARLLCDDHPADDVAFTVVEPDLSARELTYGELGRESARFAAALADLGIGPGDRVAVLMSRSIELIVTLLGIWRRGAVLVPLSTALGRPAIATRLRAADVALVVVDADRRTKLAAGEGVPADPRWQVVVVRGEPGRRELSFEALMALYLDDPLLRPVAVGGDGLLALRVHRGDDRAAEGDRRAGPCAGRVRRRLPRRRRPARRRALGHRGPGLADRPVLRDARPARHRAPQPAHPRRDRAGAGLAAARPLPGHAPARRARHISGPWPPRGRRRPGSHCATRRRPASRCRRTSSPGPRRCSAIRCTTGTARPSSGTVLVDDAGCAARDDGPAVARLERRGAGRRPRRAGAARRRRQARDRPVAPAR